MVVIFVNKDNLLKSPLLMVAGYLARWLLSCILTVQCLATLLIVMKAEGLGSLSKLAMSI